MREYLMMFGIFILMIVCILLMMFGIQIGNFKIFGYKEIQRANISKTNMILELNHKNVEEYQFKKQELKSAVNEYKNKKIEYDKLVESGEIIESSVTNSYSMNFIWSTLQNYIEGKGITLNLELLDSDTASTNPNCTIYDLSFSVEGEYIDITNFIYSIEDDDYLKFEISNFLLEKAENSLKATFLVKNIPINNENE